MRPHDWAWFAAIGAAVLAVAALLRGNLAWAAGWAVLAISADMAGRVWSRKHPGPMPHVIRWTLLFPRGPHSPTRLKRILEPRSGERMLEIGAGVGVHALPIAAALLPDGVLDVLDVQQQMLDDLTQRAARAGVTNIVAKRADAQTLPYADQTFDAAYLVCVLGELPDGIAALRELRRVLKPEGRLVIGEILFDPDYISPSVLRGKAEAAGLVLERKLGPGLAYFALFRPGSLTVLSTFTRSFAKRTRLAPSPSCGL